MKTAWSILESFEISVKKMISWGAIKNTLLKGTADITNIDSEICTVETIHLTDKLGVRQRLYTPRNKQFKIYQGVYPKSSQSHTNKHTRLIWTGYLVNRRDMSARLLQLGEQCPFLKELLAQISKSDLLNSIKMFAPGQGPTLCSWKVSRKTKNMRDTQSHKCHPVT